MKNPAVPGACIGELSAMQEVIAAELFNAWDTCGRIHFRAPWGSGKTLIFIGFVLWVIGQDPNHRFIYVSAAFDIAKARVQAIADYIETDPDYQAVFPKIKPYQGKKWSPGKGLITVQRDIISPDPTVSAYGIDKVGIGTRGSVIYDDACDRDDLLSEIIRTRREGQMFSTWNSRIDTGCMGAGIDTPWHAEDANAKLSEKWRTIVFKVAKGDTHLEIEGGDYEGSIKMERWLYLLMQDKIADLTPREFDRGCRMIPVDAAQTMFKEDWIVRRDYLEMGGPYILYGGVDPAWGRRRTSAEKKRLATEPCNTAIVLGILFPKTGKVLVVEDIQSTESPEEMYDRTIDAWVRWRGNPLVSEGVIGFEVAFAQGFLFDKLRERCKVKGVSLPLVQHRQTIKKEFRLENLVPIVESADVMFDPSIETVIRQLLSYPFGKKVDGIDALEIMLHYARKSRTTKFDVQPSPTDTAGILDREL